VLSQRLSIICGYVVIRWSVLRDFCDQMNRHMLYYLLLSPHSKNGPNSYFPNNVVLIENMRANFLTQAKCDFWRLWEISNARDVTKQIDRIYGMLGLASENFRRKVPVEYGPSGNGDLRKTLIICAKACIEEDPTLALLSMIEDGSDDIELPSWCPRLEKGHSIRRRLDRTLQAGYFLHDQRPSQVVTYSSTDTISIHGFHVDKIASVVHDTMHTLADSSQDVQKWYQHNKSCLSEYLKLAQRTYNKPTSIPMAHLYTLTQSMQSHNTESAERLRKIYEDFIESMEVLYENGNEEHPSAADIAEFHMFYETMTKTCNGRRYFSTVGGRVGIGPSGIRPGDTVCVFDSAGPLFVLREGINRRLVGETYVHGLMRLEETLKKPHGKNERFQIA